MLQTCGWWFKPILACSLLTSAGYAANEQYAVVRIPSHGASATVIDTGPGYAWLLGCGHAYRGADRSKAMVFDICRTTKAEPKPVGSRLIALDYEMDLSLVLLNDGPLEYIARVAPIGHDVQGHQILSCGFDEMKFPMHQDPTTLLSDAGGTWYTREKPWHGRSGGGLIDSTSGYLIGVVQGYEVMPPKRGLYVDLKTIQTFIQRYNAKGQGVPSTPQQGPSSPQRPKPCPGNR